MIATCRPIVLAAALALRLWAPGARAGGGSFGQDEDTTDQDSGPSFFGYVKDKSGDAVDDAKITVSVKNLNSTMILRTDSQGHFMVRGFDKSIDPATIDIACSKDGFKEVANVRVPQQAVSAPIEVDCILEHQ